MQIRMYISKLPFCMRNVLLTDSPTPLSGRRTWLEDSLPESSPSASTITLRGHSIGISEYTIVPSVDFSGETLSSDGKCCDQEKSLSVGQVWHWLLWNGRVELDIMKPSMSASSRRSVSFTQYKIISPNEPPIADCAWGDAWSRKFTENVGSLRDGESGLISRGYS